jgi:ketosteroid isomerase-like protein
VSESPRDAVARGFEAWNSGDVEMLLATLDPEIVWEPSGAFPGIGTRYEGHDGVRAFWREFMAPWESMSIRATEVRDLGEDVVLVRVLFHGRGREGIEVEQDFGQRYEIREGLLHRMRSYGSWDAALAATGEEGGG